MFSVQVNLKDSNGQTMEESTENPTMDDALEFIKRVKEVFVYLNDGKSKYEQFGSALDNFYHHRLSREGLVATVEALFEGCGNLSSGFKNFLPKKQETKRVVRIVNRNKKYPRFESRRQECHEFLDKVRARFPGNPEVYKSFLEMMIKYKDRQLDIAQVSEKIFTLLIGHADLVYEFEGFVVDQDHKTRKEVEKIRVFTIDDYMNELEVLLSNLRTSIRRLQKVLGLLKPDSEFDPESDPESNSSPESEDPLRGLRFRCFQRFYGQFDMEKIEALKKSPKEIFPDVLSQLEQKEQELVRYRSYALNFLVEIRRLHCISRKRKARLMLDDCWDLG